MKKIIVRIVIIATAIAVIFAVGKNIIVKKAVTEGVKVITGLTLSIDEMNVGIIKTLIGISELKLYNPQGFEDTLMADIPEIYVDYDLAAFFKKKVHLEEVRLDLKEFIVVKNKQGQLNIDSLKAMQEQEEGKPKKEKKDSIEKIKIQIDILKLKIGRVIYKDYTDKKGVAVKEFNVNIDAEYKNITDPGKLVKLIVAKALVNTTISQMANIKDGLLDAGKNVGGNAVDAAKKTTDVLKSILPFGKKN